jgi:hypothetical protein
MRRGLIAATAALALAPTAHAAEGSVAVATAPGGSLALTATYAEPGDVLTPSLGPDRATIAVRRGGAEVLRLTVATPAGGPLDSGTYDTATGASITMTPTCAGLAGTFTVQHAIPGAARRAPTELYLTASLHCGAETAATTVAVRIARAGARNETTERPRAFMPLADGLALAWSSTGAGGVAEAFFLPATGARQSFRRARESFLSQGLSGGRAIVQHLSLRGTRFDSNLELWQLAPKRRLSLPASVTTSRWEWGGALSGDWMLYQRGEVDARTKAVHLVNVVTGARRTLISAVGRSTYLEANDINGDFAAFHRCKPRCRSYVYQVSTRRTRSIAPPAGRSDYAPAVLDDGTLYFVRSAAGCGKLVRIMRLDAGATEPVEVRKVPTGLDITKMDITRFAGTRLLYAERFSCKRGGSEIRRLVEAPPPPP